MEQEKSLNTPAPEKAAAAPAASVPTDCAGIIEPMTFRKLLLRRHSIRRYTNKTVDPDAVKLILEAALLAPSSKSKRPWQFVVDEDKEKLLAMSKCKPVAAHALKTCAFAVAVCADPEGTDMVLEDCAIAAEFMQLQAAVQGIGSCWVQVRNRDAEDGSSSEDVIRRILNIPPSIMVECVMTFGYSAEVRRPVAPDKLRWEKVHIESWREEPEQ